MIGFYCLVIFKTIKTGKLNKEIRWRTKLLLLISFLLFLFYIARVIWNFFDLIDENEIKEEWKKTFKECINNDFEWFILKYLYKGKI